MVSTPSSRPRAWDHVGVSLSALGRQVQYPLLILGILESADKGRTWSKPVQITAAGQYFVRVTNFWGSAISSNAVLAVVQVPGVAPSNGTLQFDLTAGQPHLQFTGLAGQEYFVEASTNLVDWTVIGTAADLGDGRFEFFDPDWTNYSACFYRIVAH